MRAFWIVLFATAAGFTASGIVACLYRLLGAESESRSGRILRSVVMVVAGPIVIFETAILGLIRKEWSPLAFWLVAAALAYWSLALGLFILDVAIRM